MAVQAIVDQFSSASQDDTASQAGIAGGDNDEIEDAGTALPGNGLTPTELRKLYGLDQIQFANGVKADGMGMTVAIVLSYDYPTIWADLQAFDQQFGLPDPPSFIRIAADGTRNYPAQLNPNGSGEADMDTQMVHAMAPGANIIFVEAASQSRADVDNAIEYAESLPGVDIVSVSSNGTSEFSTETGLDVDFTTPTGHNGVTVIGSSGDNDAPGGYKAYSPNVVALGGTTVTRNANGTFTEVGWGDGNPADGGSGGGISQYEPQPSYQQGVVSAYSTTMRTNPDLAMVASGTGAAVYDPTDFGTSTPWHNGGGTSLSAPLFAGIMAIIDQGRALAGLGSLDGGTQTLSMLYSHEADFNDITSGNNGFAAGPGYDLVTGLGSPKAQLLTADMIRTSGMTAIATTPAAGSLVAASQTDYTVYFSDAYDPASIQASDLSVNGIAANSYTLTSATAVTFHYLTSPLTATDVQTLSLANGAIARQSDGALLSSFQVNFATSAAPALTVPATQVTLEGAALQFAIGADTQISLTENYDPGGDKQITLTASHGTLSITSENQLTAVSGNDTSTIVMTGSVARMNAALIGLTFTPDPNFVGSAQLQVNANDLGNNGTGQAATDSKTIVVQVRPTASASLVSDIAVGTASSSPSNLLAVGNIVYFAATDATHGTELWKSDGTAAGTTMVADINTGSGSSSPTNLTYYNGYVYFTATDATHGSELWRTDGTLTGTTIVADINSGANSSSPANFTVVGNQLFFTANDGTHGNELWVINGAASPALVKDINTGSSSASPTNLVNAGGVLMFAATDTTHGKELWESDGTSAGTVLVADINAGSSSSSLANLTVVGSTVFFTANDGTDGTELWKWTASDGAAMVSDIYPGSTSGTPNSSSPTRLTAAGSMVYFIATDATHGSELWKSDGTAAGTQLVRNVNNGNDSAAIGTIAYVNGVVYFSAADGSHSTELWKTDGTAAGTNLVDDILAGGTSSTPANFQADNGVLYFSANDGTNGKELWQSDGQAASTFRAADISNGTTGSSPANLTVTANGTLFFTATDATHGTELWVVPGNAAPTTAGLAPINVIEGVASSTVKLAASFADDTDQSNGLLYTITGDTNATLFSSIAIDPNTGVLTLSYATKQSGTATLTMRAIDSSGAFVETSLSVDVDAPPTVMGVYVSGGSSWDSSYYAYLDTAGYGNGTVTGLGYNVSNGANQLVSLPWLKLNTINILFSEDVNVTEDSLQIIGSATSGAPTAPTPSGYSYNASLHVATWTFASPLAGDRILLHFDASSVTDSAGATLDGYWQDGVSSSIAGSGDGAQGSDFNFMTYVLPGDQLNQQTVTLADAKQIVPYINLSVGDNGYDYRKDVLGQGTITLADAKQIVPLINSDISGLDDPTAPAQSDAESQTSDDDADFAVADTLGFATIVNLSSDPVVPSADPRLVADNALELIVSPQIASDDTTMPLYQDANASTSRTVTLPPPSVIDHTAMIDYLFSDGVDWLPSSTRPLPPVALNTSAALAPAPAASTTGSPSQPPAAVPVTTARIGGAGRTAFTEEMAEMLGENQETWRFARMGQSDTNRQTNAL